VTREGERPGPRLLLMKMTASRFVVGALRVLLNTASGLPHAPSIVSVGAVNARKNR
jgi:hypothetical protein